MKQKNRICVLALAMLILATILFSYGFLIEKMHHDCTGEECTVCLELDMAVRTISGCKLLPNLPLVVAFLCVFTQIRVAVIRPNRTKNTLITLKVELLD